MKQKIKITMLWKFFFWIIVWTLIIIPAFFIPLRLEGILLYISVGIGFTLFTYSMLLVTIGGKTIARYGHKKKHETFWPDKFSRNGIFGCMRHPMHLGLTIYPVAVALASGYVLAIVASGWGVAAALWFILVIEEKDTIEKYGEIYTEYMKEVPPFSLKWECIKKELKIITEED